MGEVKTMDLRVSTPARELELGALVSLRFLAPDGWRGVLPGHEPARATVLEGPLRCVDAGGDRRGPRTRWLATEGGVLLIDRAQLRLLTRWVIVADSLERLRVLVETRDSERTRLEGEARALALRHELATRRALVSLERTVSKP